MGPAACAAHADQDWGQAGEAGQAPGLSGGCGSSAQGRMGGRAGAHQRPASGARMPFFWTQEGGVAVKRERDVLAPLADDRWEQRGVSRGRQRAQHGGPGLGTAATIALAMVRGAVGAPCGTDRRLRGVETVCDGKWRLILHAWLTPSTSGKKSRRLTIEVSALSAPLPNCSASRARVLNSCLHAAAQRATSPRCRTAVVAAHVKNRTRISKPRWSHSSATTWPATRWAQRGGYVSVQRGELPSAKKQDPRYV